MEEILNSLNPGQREAVLHCDGPSLVIAGAGSGKTRVLTTKIAYLLHRGLHPSTVLALTFTNKAAKEMKERIGKMVGQTTASRLWMGTFHSIFSRILRAEAEHIGFSSDFTIYDSADTKNLLKTIVKEMKLDDKVYKPNAVYSRISAAKNALYTPGMYAASQQLMEQDFASKMPEIRNIYQVYAQRCKAAGAMDFDDLLLYTNILFRDHPEVLEKYRNRFMFILVDEYQDTNYAQHLIVQQLSASHHRVCVVGDDAQSIYSFRGANIDNILNFKSTFPECKVFKLEQNYRSTQTIVDAANSLISKNRQQIKKNVFSENEIGEKIRLFSAYSDYEEGYLVANKIAEMRLTSHAEYRDFVILYRTNAQSRIMEEALRKRNIPYRIYGGLSFYQRKEIKDVIAYCRLLINPRDEEAFKRILNYPARGIGDTTLGKISDAALMHNASMWQVLSAPLDYALKINAGTAKKLSGFKELIDTLSGLTGQTTAYEQVLAVVKMSGIAADLQSEGTVEAQTKTQNIEELLKGVQEYCMMKQEEGIENPSLADFLSEVSLATDQDTDNEADRDKVTMMTIHSAKGLEFRHVFIVGMEEDLFPSSMSKMSARELEEERRLFYVALTRAEKSCTLTYSKSRFRHGVSNMTSPSRFLKDIDTTYLIDHTAVATGNTLFSAPAETVSAEQQRKGTNFNALAADVSQRAANFRQKLSPVSEVNKKPVQAATTNLSTSQQGAGGDLAPGVHVQHERFGSGIVKAIEGAGDNRKAIVQFETFGEKTLLLRFARLVIV
ncbi:MAG: ATP-dependent helicase [Bacteroidales bacterium]